MLKEAILGKWKSCGVLEDNGVYKEEKVPISLTFKENGKGRMKFFFVPSGFTWGGSSGSYFLRSADLVQTLMLKGNLLYLLNGSQPVCVFERA